MEHRTLPGSRTPQVLELHDQGLTTREIATRLDMTTQAVYRALSRYDRKPNRKET